MNAIVERTEALPIRQNVDIEGMLFKAIDSGVPVETMERLLAMRDKIMADQAKSDFFQALARFQADCPPIRKERAVKSKSGEVRYSYASLDDIVKQVGPVLRSNNLSFTIDTVPGDGFLTAITTVHHINGHSESSSFMVPIDRDSFMNDAQKSGSANAYAKRYSFCNALGILTSDQDDDAQSLGNGIDPKDIYKQCAFLVSAVLEHADTIKAIKQGIADDDLSAAAEAWNELTQEEKQSIWVAPSKGGPFTTNERNVMKSTEFREAALSDKPDEESV